MNRAFNPCRSAGSLAAWWSHWRSNFSAQLSSAHSWGSRFSTGFVPMQSADAKNW